MTTAPPTSALVATGLRKSSRTGVVLDGIDLDTACGSTATTPRSPSRGVAASLSSATSGRAGSPTATVH